MSHCNRALCGSIGERSLGRRVSEVGHLRIPAERRRNPLKSNRPSLRCRGQETKKNETAQSGSTASEEFDTMLSPEQLAKLAELRSQKEGGGDQQSNWVQGAIEESRLIDWPPPGKAFTQTVLVISIVAGTSLMLFGLNTALADLSRWFYGLN
ncbi:hypothetical protein BSKO_00359 [Bryopsis sp. KO-2023]|nr:hypothetical protein BSKO_00359 [Bryopsis sp. KO-2023]